MNVIKKNKRSKELASHANARRTPKGHSRFMRTSERHTSKAES